MSSSSLLSCFLGVLKETIGMKRDNDRKVMELKHELQTIIQMLLIGEFISVLLSLLGSLF